MLQSACFRLTFVMLFLYIVYGRRISSPNTNTRLVPPQPSQYSTSMIINGRSTKYYADTTIDRDRVDDLVQQSTMIINYQSMMQYIIKDESCTRSRIPGKIKPFLSFPTYTFNGNLTYNGTTCNEWTGCHDYEIPPAPFNYYATTKDNTPVDLILPTVGVSIHFSNFTFGPPPSNIFDIPSNCTEIEFNIDLHPVLSVATRIDSDVEIFC